MRDEVGFRLAATSNSIIRRNIRRSLSLKENEVRSSDCLSNAETVVTNLDFVPEALIGLTRSAAGQLVCRISMGTF